MLPDTMETYYDKKYYVYYLHTENEKLPPDLRRKILSRDGFGLRTNQKVLKIFKIFPDPTLSEDYFGPRYWKVLYEYKTKGKKNANRNREIK